MDKHNGLHRCPAIFLAVFSTPQFVKEILIWKNGDSIDFAHPWLKADAQIALKLFFLHLCH